LESWGSIDGYFNIITPTIIKVRCFFRFSAKSRFQSSRGKHILDLSALNDANICKDVFLAYLNAALLDPVMAIGGMEETTRQEMLINVVTLGSICTWIWLITDAFDYTDVCQSFKYQ